MNEAERRFANSIKNKIKKYKIPIKASEAIEHASGVFLYTQYNNGEEELIDTGVEWFICSQSPYYFIENYCWIDFPGKGVVPFRLYYFQSEMMKEIEDLDKVVFLKTRQCCRATNFVKTKDRGYISIRDVKSGDEIETLVDGKPSYTFVEDAWKVGKREITRILTNSGQAVECTLDHPILTVEGWKEAQNITVKDEIVNAVGIGEFGSYSLEYDELAALIGYYIADGNYSNPVFTNTNLNYINECLEAGRLIENCNPYVNKYKQRKNRKQAYDVRFVSKKGISNKSFKSFMEEFGLDKMSINRHLTPELLELNERQMSILINRLFAGDGWITYKKDKRRSNYIQYEIGLGSPNFTLIKQMEYILQTKYGIHCWIQDSPFNGNDFWKLRITQKKSVIDFIKRIGIKDKTNREDIQKLISKEKPYKSNQPIGKVRKIEHLEELEEVYDITTGTSDFLTNGLMVHNCGISTVFSLYCFWRGNFKESESIDVISIKQAKAQAFVNKINPTIKRLPAFLKTEIVNKNQTTVKWANGSTILSESASDKAGRGDTLSFLVLDEVAFYLSDKLTRGIISAAQPTLTRTGGKMILISCLTDDTYIFTDKGIEQIKDYKPVNSKLGFNDIPEFKIDGMNLQQKCNTFYDSGITPTIKLTTNNGIEIEGSYIHPLMVMENGRLKFKQLQELTKEDILVIKKGSNSFGNYKKINFNYKKEVHNGKDFIVDEIDESLAYVFGLYLAEGHINCDYKKHYKLNLAITEEDIRNKIRNFAKKYSLHITEGKKSFTISSKGLIKLFEFVGFDISKKSRTKEIPPNLLKMPKELTREMLIGMFDGDGCNNIKSNTIDYTSYSNKILKQVHLLLMNFGIFSKLDKKNNRILITKDRKIFLDKIGFNLERKNIFVKSVETKYPIFDFVNGIVDKYNLDKKHLQKKGCDLYIRKNRKNNRSLEKKSINVFINENKNLPEIKEIEYLVDKNLDFDYITNIEYGEANTYDFTIPETKSFIANGIVSSNTPNGSAGSGAYYYEQVQQLLMAGNDNKSKLIEIDWFEVPDVPKVNPKKGYNKLLNKYIKLDYFNKPEVRRAMRAEFEPITSNWKENEWLKKQHDDLGDILFKQEILHSFIISGDQVFTEETFEKLKTKVVPPKIENQLGKTQIKGLWIWNEPVPKNRYIMGIDVSSGTSDDYSSIQIMNVETYEQVAEYKGRMGTKTLGKLAKTLGRYYNEAFMVIECNSIGEAVFNEVYYSDTDAYSNVYRKKKSNNGVTRMTGFETTVKSRQLIINQLIDWINIDELWDKLTIKSSRMFSEFLTWVYRNGRIDHAEGCVSGDTLITTDKGLRLIKDIKEGDLVLTHKNRFKPVSKVFKFKDDKKQMLKVKAFGKPYLNITSNQEFYIEENNEYKFKNFDRIYNFKNLKALSSYSKEVNDISYVDLLEYNKEYKYDDDFIYWNSNTGERKIRRFIKLDDEFLFFIGHVLADGSISEKNKGTISITTNLEELNIKEFYINYFNKYGIEIKDAGNFLTFGRFNIHNIILFNFLKGIKTGEHKTVPEILRFISPEKQLNILYGYMFGDGSFELRKNRPPKLTSATISYQLSHFIESILFRNGISFNVNRNTSYRYNKKNKDQYKITIIGEECEKFIKLNSFNEIYALKNNYDKFKLHKFKNIEAGKLSKIENNYISSKFMNVENIEWDDYYYDLTVEEDHSYIANNYIVHNSHDDSLIAFALCLYHRNEADSYGQSFLLIEDGSLLQIKDEEEFIKEPVNEVSRAFSATEFDTPDEFFQDNYGCSYQEYNWLIK